MKTLYILLIITSSLGLFTTTVIIPSLKKENNEQKEYIKVLEDRNKVLQDRIYYISHNDSIVIQK